MGDTLKKISSLTVILGIYLYFIAWVYVHFYYQRFGISTEAIKIDYSTYLMYSYNVLSSALFLNWVVLAAALLLLRAMLLWMVQKLARRKTFFMRMHIFLSNNFITQSVKKLRRQYALWLLILFLVVIFPFLFSVARTVAIDNYQQDRLHTEHLKTIQFVFRKDADLLSPVVVLDSLLSPQHPLHNDIALLKNDQQQLLKLLGESDNYYIVLQQRPFNKTVGALPSGFVYFVNKQDVLLSKIILRSL